MIREFETGPELARNTVDVEPIILWRCKVSINMKLVASARPWYTGTEICMCGQNYTFPINIPYEEFMTLWMSVKE